MSRIEFEAGEYTEELLQFILNATDEEALDEMEVARTHAESTGLAGEPISTAVVLTLAVPATVGVVRLIERWIEKKRQEAHITAVLKGFDISAEAGQAMIAITESHAGVSSTHTLYDASAAGE